MTEPDLPDGSDTRQTLEIEVEPTVTGRFARWLARARVLRARVEHARGHHPSLELAFDIVESDSSIGGGLLAGALAYRLFVLLLPSALLFVSGLGLYAGAVDKSPSTVAKDAGLHGLIASQVASTASSNARWLVFIVMLPVVLYATAKLYRAVAIVHAIVWHGSGRGVRITPRGLGLFGASLLLTLFVNVFNVYVTTRLVEDRADTYGALGIAAALLFSLVLVGRLMVVSAELNASLAAHRARRP